MAFGPNKQDFQDLLISSLGALLAGMIGSIFIIILSFAISGYFDIDGTFNNVGAGTKRNAIFPFILSFITLIGTSISSFLTYYILNMTAPDKYKKNIVVLGQIAFFQVFIYIFLGPVYVMTGLIDYDNVLIIYLVHILILTFGQNLLMEVLSNYRYILVGLYGSFMGLFVSSIITLMIFTMLDPGRARLIVLIALLPLINFLSVFFKQLFERAYYGYHKLTGLDQIGDIFYQIELEEKELLKEEEQKNTL